MSNKKKTQEAEQKARMAEEQARAAQAAAEEERKRAAANAQQQVQITPQAQQVLTQSGQDYNNIRSGNLTQVAGIANYLATAANQRKANDRLSATGSASLAQDVANPNIIAMNRDKLNRESAQQDALAITGLRDQAEQSAVERIGAVSGMDLSAKTSLANFLFQNAGLAQGNVNLSQNLYNQAMANYQNERNKRSFFKDLALTAVGGAAQVGAAALGGK